MFHFITNIIKNTCPLKDCLCLYPNPATDIINIKLSNNEISKTKDIQLNMFDYLGRKINTFEINTDKLKIDISDKPTGIYYLQIMAGNKFFKTVKLIVNE